MSLCEWEPCLDQPASEIEGLADSRIGCPNEAVVVLGARGDWHLCASCAELPAFRKFRVAQLLDADADVTLRRDSAGWWVAGELVPPAPLAEVLARLALPVCPEHGRYMVLRRSPLGRGLVAYCCPVRACLVSGPSAEDEQGAAQGWREVLK